MGGNCPPPDFKRRCMFLHLFYFKDLTVKLSTDQWSLRYDLTSATHMNPCPYGIDLTNPSLWWHRPVQLTHLLRSVWGQLSVWHRCVLMCFQLFVGTHGVWIHGRDRRILPAASEIITLLIRPDLPIKEKSAVLPQNLKAASDKPSAAEETDRSSTR